MDKELFRQEYIDVEGGKVPILLEFTSDGLFVISIDSEEWFSTSNVTHAVVVFELLLKHVTEYIEFKVDIN